MKQTMWMMVAVILTMTATVVADKADTRLASVRKVFVQPADELGEDVGITACVVDHLPKLTPIQIVTDKAEAEAIFEVRGHLPSTTTKMLMGAMGGSPSAHLTVTLPDGKKLWDDGAKYRRSMMQQGQLGASSADTSKSIECGLADGLIEALRNAMRKARDDK